MNRTIQSALFSRTSRPSGGTPSLFIVAMFLVTGPVALVAAAAAAQKPSTGIDSQWAGSSARNNVVDAQNIPAEWEVGRFDFRTDRWLGEGTKNIKWVAKLGSESYGSPVVAGGKIYCATNNGNGYLDRYPKDVDLGCLLAFSASDGSFLWQHSSEKLKEGDAVDFAQQGICCSPMIEGDRLWVVTNRAEVLCLDTEGFSDGENDGPVTDEPSEAVGESDVVWRFEMMKELGSIQRYMCSCSVTAAGDLLLVGTSNGVDLSDKTIPAPEAPSFVALDKNTGRLIWSDNSPGENILDGQWSSPAVATADGITQAIFAGGDGWLYSFLAEATDDGNPKLLWKFDCNPKESSWGGHGRGDRNSIIATPVVAGGLVYIATGQDPESGEGQGDLWCIDPTGRGDTSEKLVVDASGNPVPPRRQKAVDLEAGEAVVDNPNSAVVWHYQGEDGDGDGKHDFEETMHRAMGLVAIEDGLLVIGDFAGLVHCLDAKTGRLQWTYDALATMWGSALIADGKIFIGDEDGDVAVLELARQLNVLAENNVGNSIYSAPTIADGVLFISSRSHLMAIVPDDE